MKNVARIFGFLFATTCLHPLQGDPQDITHTVISGLVNNAKHRFRYRVEVNLLPFRKKVGGKHYHGYAGKGEFLCSSLSIALDGREIAIPKAAYDDLAEITSVGSPDDADNDKWILRVDGGSGGECYFVEFYFSNMKLLERRFLEKSASGEAREYRSVEKF